MYVKYAHTIALLLLVAASFYGGWYVNGARWEAKHSELVADYATAQVTANEAIRSQERLWQDKLSKVTNDAKIKQESLQRDSAELSAVAARLRKQIADHAANNKGANSTAADISRAAATDRVMYSVMLESVIIRAEQYARFADETRAAGVACQNSYNALH